MTAQLLEYTTPADVRARRSRAARTAAAGVADARRRARVNPTAHWSASQAQACQVSRPVAHAAPVTAAPVTAAAPAARRLEWTPRGVAVMVILVAVLFTVMASTLVGAFLSVSNEPAAAVAAPLAAVVAPQSAGH